MEGSERIYSTPLPSPLPAHHVVPMAAHHIIRLVGSRSTYPWCSIFRPRTAIVVMINRGRGMKSSRGEGGSPRGALHRYYEDCFSHLVQSATFQALRAEWNATLAGLTFFAGNFGDYPIEEDISQTWLHTTKSSFHVLAQTFANPFREARQRAEVQLFMSPKYGMAKGWHLTAGYDGRFRR